VSCWIGPDTGAPGYARLVSEVAVRVAKTAIAANSRDPQFVVSVIAMSLPGSPSSLLIGAGYRGGQAA
jgi:hypothetical protein